MAQTIYASFVDVRSAQKAVGALLDKGVEEDSLSMVTKQTDFAGEEEEVEDPQAQERSAEHGLTTTTREDAMSGAKKGGAMGLGIGAVAAIASIVVPGFGVVAGGGALAMAIGGALGATAAGAVAGGAVGYLKDQGVAEDVAHHYAKTLEAEGAVVSVDLPSGDATEADVQWVFDKYGGQNVHATPAMVAAGIDES
ncbi:MAG: hypothetical protein ABFE08_09980 [Armatimonadia bacterium]